jgi:hypothetical protein
VLVEVLSPVLTEEIPRYLSKWSLWGWGRALLLDLQALVCSAVDKATASVEVFNSRSPRAPGNVLASFWAGIGRGSSDVRYCRLQ